MTAPGDNLEFYESTAFTARVRDREGVRTALQEQLRNSPNAGRRVCGQLYVLELDVDGRIAGYIYGRRGQRVNVAYVFDLPREQAAFEARLADMKKLYCPGNPRSRP